MRHKNVRLHVMNVVRTQKGPDYFFTRRINTTRYKVTQAIKYLIAKGHLKQVEGSLHIVKEYVHDSHDQVTI